MAAALASPHKPLASRRAHSKLRPHTPGSAAPSEKRLAIFSRYNGCWQTCKPKLKPPAPWCKMRPGYVTNQCGTNREINRVTKAHVASGHWRHAQNYMPEKW